MCLAANGTYNLGMKNRSETPSSEKYPWTAPTGQLNCFQNGVKAVVETLRERTKNPHVEIPRLWVVKYGSYGDHTYLVWKGKVFNKGVTSVADSAFFVGPDRELSELQADGQDRTEELLNELVVALKGGDSGLHNLKRVLEFVDVDKEAVLRMI